MKPYIVKYQGCKNIINADQIQEIFERDGVTLISMVSCEHLIKTDLTLDEIYQELCGVRSAYQAGGFIFKENK